ncbi:uncharacterized protein A1O9_04863 [Exophiala aquamarina CBS 119918]|uniref:WLM domain-containing protein n=1 Tax=Exophiala aquamarina CBS 119918 TaxID=1182545 RepID=A0A072PKZ2_9EURO|nr:uncharacterized protein A1O9_04863 [Exophiala aquamarina CBS 119918]KEF60013.1 hypothetical protein A1O9_04863 [Exophiala aquamarina CBS 119918]
MSHFNTRELDPLIDQFQHLRDKRRGGEALHILRKVASIVKPIMRQRSWRVGTLAEFFPPESNLLGLNTNHGDRIDLRLRYAGDENQFLPMEEIIDTMLHELCHIVHGPHNDHFYALWAKLQDEHKALTAKGYTGEGFLGKGDRLGGQRLPMHEMRRRARVAAQERADRTRNSGSVLGGKGILRGQSARDVIAAAAEKRAKSERGCANGTEEGRKLAEGKAPKGGQVTTTKADQEDENEAAWIQAMIELVREDEAQMFNQDHLRPDTSLTAGLDAASIREEQARIERSIKQQSRPAKRPPTRPPPETWTCEVCTLINPIDDLRCGACEIERPPDSFPPPRRARNKSPSSATSTSTSTIKKSTPTALQPRLNAYDSIARIESQAARMNVAKPMGWTCHSCGNWMEEMWWTCSTCGMMKASS